MPSSTPDDALRQLLADARIGVLATIKADGRPQLTNVSHHYDRASDIIRVSITDTRAKTRNLRRDPRASYHVTGAQGWAYAVAEATAQLSPVTTGPGDATAQELVDLYRAIAGEHPDWDEYRAAMVADQRLVLRLPVERVYGMAPRAA